MILFGVMVGASVIVVTLGVAIFTIRTIRQSFPDDGGDQ